MINFMKVVEEICAKDARYKPDSYEFVIKALHFSRKKLKKTGHVSGKELSEGVRDFAIDQYGPMAKSVLAHWGIHKTIDIGNIVYTMIERKLLSKTEEDSLGDFKDVYDFEAAFSNVISRKIKKIKKITKKSLQNKN